MALEEYLGSIVMEIDGQEIEIESFKLTKKTGRKRVDTMNKTGRSKGFTRGIATYDLSVSAVIPLNGGVDWDAIEGAKITQYPLSVGGKRISYLDCFTIDVGEQYSVGSEARIDITMAALREVVE